MIVEYFSMIEHTIKWHLFFYYSNKTISANNTPSVSPCSSPTVLKKDVFNKINHVSNVKSSVDGPSSQAATVMTPSSFIHRHHRNTSTVSQNENVLTSQPSTQSIGTSSDQSYSSISTENGSNKSYSIRRPPAVPVPSSPATSDSMTTDSSPSINETSSSSINPPQTPNNNQWRHKLNNLKQSFQIVGTPRFHRRPKVIMNENDNSVTSNSPSHYGTTPEATKKSLFHHIIDAMQEDHHMIVVKDRPLSAIKTDLIHAFLSVWFDQKTQWSFIWTILFFSRRLILFIMFYLELSTVVNIEDRIDLRCFSAIFVFMWKFVQWNQSIHQLLTRIISHSHWSRVR